MRTEYTIANDLDSFIRDKAFSFESPGGVITVGKQQGW
jgi:hypothetical protein